MLPLLANPISLASLGLTALSTGDKAKDFVVNNYKTILAVLGVAATSYIVYDKFIKNDAQTQIKENKTLPPSALTDQEAKVIADELFEAMKEAGTEKQRIYNALTGLTYNDFVKVSEQFGFRYYLDLTGEQSVWWMPTSEELNLQEWLRKELDAEELAVIQQIMPEVMTKTTTPTVGAEVMAAKTVVNAYDTEKQDGIWYQKDLEKQYQQGEVIGEILNVIQDPFEADKKVLIIDQSGWFDFGNVMVNANDVTVI